MQKSWKLNYVYRVTDLKDWVMIQMCGGPMQYYICFDDAGYQNTT